jgi:hypothetical protein
MGQEFLQMGNDDGRIFHMRQMPRAGNKVKRG